MRLKISNITKRFGAVVANEDISLTLDKSEVLALLGENGAGKTTLMNIIFGHYVSDDGYIEVDGLRLPQGVPQAAIDAGIGMVHQHFTLADNLSVLDNITLGTESLFSFRRNIKAAKNKLNGLAEQFGLMVNPDAMVADLSVGEKQRVEILKALYRDARILILDEPTAVLTPQEVDSLFKILRDMVEQDLSIMFVSHKLHEILAISDRVAVLRHGRVVDEVATQDATKESLSTSMVGHEVSRPKAAQLAVGDVAMELKGVSLPAIAGSVALKDVNLQVHQYEIVGVAGVAGNGQTGLASILNGQSKPSAGELRLYNEVIKRHDCQALVEAGVGRIPEDRTVDGVVGEMQIWENMIGEKLKQSLKSGVFIDRDAALKETNQLIEQFDVRCEGPEAKTNLLSGGNIQKLILARSLSNNPRFVIANQPIRGLDEGAISYVQSQLVQAKENGAGVLLISEDLDELFGIADRIAVMFDGVLFGPFPKDALDTNSVGLMMSGTPPSDAITAEGLACA